MSKRDYSFYLIDIIEALARIEKYTMKISKQRFVKNEMVIDSVIRNLEIIGEAAKHIPSDIRSMAPEIPWQKVVGFRNILIHEYFNVDLENAWYIIKEQLPSLKKEIKTLLAEVKKKSKS